MEVGLKLLGREKTAGYGVNSLAGNIFNADAPRPSEEKAEQILSEVK